MTLVLNEIAAPPSCGYHHVEVEDVFGVGFHLKGGSRFIHGAKEAATGPFDVWACASPMGARTEFVLSENGFRTAALRFTLEAATEMFEPLGADASAVHEIVAAASSETRYCRLGSMSPRSARLVEDMFASRYVGGLRSLHLEAGALALLAELGSQEATVTSPSGETERQLLAARLHLDEHLLHPPTIVQLARIVGINDFALKRGFKERFGTTLFGYVRQRRMEQAWLNLGEGMSVAAAALQVGYECPRCFADAFRRHYGVLPSESARSVRIPARIG